MWCPGLSPLRDPIQVDSLRAKLIISGWDYAFYDWEERTGGCTGDHLERVTSPPGEERPTELVLAVQGASPEPLQPCHELPCPTPYISCLRVYLRYIG